MSTSFLPLVLGPAALGLLAWGMHAVVKSAVGGAPKGAKDATPASKDAAGTDDEPEYPYRPWWREGGLKYSQVLAAFTIIVPSICFAKPLFELGSWLPVAAYFAFGLCWSANMWPIARIHGFPGDYPTKPAPEHAVDFFCVAIIPLYMMGLLAPVFWPSMTLGKYALMATLAVLYFLYKGGICMSLCLHRYASHAAFRCGPITQFAVCWVGCLANQGGPIWWASRHRVHHKYCEAERDPHSAERVGIPAAFVFFAFPCNQSVDEEFAPPHIDSVRIRMLDTFSGVPVVIEQYCAYCLAGLPGLWVAQVSGWLCLAVTCWFNIVNHPPHASVTEATGSDAATAGTGPKLAGLLDTDELSRPAEFGAAPKVGTSLISGRSTTKSGMCIASDKSDVSKLEAPAMFFRFLNCFLCFTSSFGEEAHLHHHDHPRCGMRPGSDFPGVALRVMSALGLVWGVYEKNGRLKQA